MSDDLGFTEEHGVWVPTRRPVHRNDEYDDTGFDTLVRMQREHFWYRGRHALLLNALENELRRSNADTKNLRAIDLGGGCGGWLAYLHERMPALFGELALGDSSLKALSLAHAVVGGFAKRFQVDLMDLHWSERWDVVFLLDVIEHIPDHAEVLRQVGNTLRPGGLAVITVPALDFFWTYNDDLAQHQRRYRKADFAALAAAAKLRLLRADYFMFFLSPALLASRWFSRPAAAATEAERLEHAARAHQVPARPLNALFASVMSIEARLINVLPFPFGTSLLAVLQKEN